MIRVGIIGAGKIAEKHLEVMDTFNDVSVLAIINRGKERREYLKQKYGISHSFSDYKLMLKEIKLDAIFVTVSLFNITEVSLNCLETGIPTFIEKPAGINTEETNMLVMASKKMKTINMVGLNRRFYSNISNALDIIKTDGGVRTIIIDAPQRLTDVNAWKGFEDKTNIWNGVHCIDLFRYFCGDIKYIKSHISKNISQYNDTFNAFIEFKNDAVGHFTSNWFAQGKWSVTLIGKSVRINICPLENGYFCNEQGKEKKLKILDQDKKYKPGFYLQDRYFIDCVISKTPVSFPGSDLNDYYKTMQLANKIDSNGGLLND